RRLLPDRPHADAHGESSAAQHVERRGRLSEPNRVVVRQHEYGGAQAHALGSRRHVAQDRQRLVVRLVADAVEDVAHVEDVIVGPHRVEAERLGPDRQLDHRPRVVEPLVVEQREPDAHRRRVRHASQARSAGISAPQGSMAGRSGVNSRTRPAAPRRIASIFARSPAVRSSSAPASLASTSAGVRAPTSAVLIAWCPSTHASAIWLSGTPRGSAISRRRRSTTATFVLKFSPRKIGWPNATPPPRQSRDASPKLVAVVKAPVSRPWPSEP